MDCTSSNQIANSVKLCDVCKCHGILKFRNMSKSGYSELQDLFKFQNVQNPGYSQNLRFVKILHHRLVPHNFKFTWRHIKFSPLLFTVQGTLSIELKRWYFHVTWKNILEELNTSVQYMLYKSHFRDSSSWHGCSFIADTKLLTKN